MADILSTPPGEAELKEMIEHAVRAPSLLNTQPWRFIVDCGAIHVYADRSRQLMALDPNGRELTMSCGAAILYLRIAARHMGWEPTVLPFPVSEETDLLAAVTFQPGHRPGGDDRLFQALALRRTNRHAFTDEAVPAEASHEMTQAVADEGAVLHVFDGPAEKTTLSRLVAAGIIDQGQDHDVIAEIELWLRPAKDPRRDGVLDTAQGMWDRHASMRTTSSAVATYKGDLIREASAVLVLSTPSDQPTDWLAAGQALARALLVAAARGLAASYANEPVEVAPLRAKVAALIGGEVPQMIFRIGYPEDQNESLRRPASDVTEYPEPAAPAPLRGVHPGHPVSG